jgi:hypothetical protein
MLVFLLVFPLIVMNVFIKKASRQTFQQLAFQRIYSGSVTRYKKTT